MFYILHTYSERGFLNVTHPFANLDRELILDTSLSHLKLFVLIKRIIEQSLQNVGPQGAGDLYGTKT